ncbi:two-component system response regulator YesN [Paenibacillus endophyticus]|uniref:Two-component system response regulator YesN n=1 Tax=Paenibacillus endophyticus TaxID=1294268 RepID=A0A7W5C5I8_9BACL|nr:response regulator [Paenibacillus endophyticus]MBB3151297.1 two-component system response regulator YesN [Paenibacillus endophyticus]
MWKLVIADDEPRIRRGLMQVLPWEELGIEVVGEAEDGIEALEVARSTKPDLLFVDINMPFLDGLAFVEQLQLEHKCLVVVITGYDEFTYAQKAVKLSVFDYILKPVVKSQLKELIDRAVIELEKNKIKEEFQAFTSKQLQNNSLLIRDNFLRRWMSGLWEPGEVEENIEYLKLPINASTRLAVFKVVQSTNVGTVKKEWGKDLLEFASRNIIEDILSDSGEHVVMEDERGYIVIFSPIADESEWIEQCMAIQTKFEEILARMVIYSDKVLSDGFLHADRVYNELVKGINAKGSLSPVVLLAKKFVEQAYAMPSLSLQEVADQVRVSPTYLSKLLKKEIGASFIDYLTDVRIKHAVLLMNDTSYKVYEIAEKVGYNSQHYFSNAFKKKTGVSPNSYRKGSWT